jgi:S1-C subfamily serine protease
MSSRFSLDALPELVSRVREAVVHVDCRTADAGVSGAGFAIPVAAADTAPGIVVTNAHVVEGDRPSVRVHSTGREEQRVKIRLIDRSTDLALLELPAAPSVVLTPREDVRVGEAVITIGSPLGYEASVTMGIVSALGRLGWGTDYVPFDGAIQTDAAITHGNSGGPLIGLDGGVVGINYRGIDEVNGINFAIPIGLAVHHYREICETGERRSGVRRLAFAPTPAASMPAAPSVLNARREREFSLLRGPARQLTRQACARATSSSAWTTRTYAVQPP